MFKTMYIVKEEDIPIARRQSGYGAINGQTVNDPDLHRIQGAEIVSEMLIGLVGHQLIECNNGQRALAQMHQYDVDGHSMQPSGECGVTSKTYELAVQLNKSFLREVFGQRKFVYHAHAN